MVGRDDLEEVPGAETAELLACALKWERTRQAFQIKGVRKRHHHEPTVGSFARL